MITVLIVEDSPVARDLLAHVLSTAGFQVIGAVGDGEAALEFVKKSRPDVVTMDIYMPRMSGLEATRRIMETTPVPIVIVSGNWDPKEVETTFRAMEAGAVAIVQRPFGIGHPGHEATVRELLQTLRIMSEVKVVRRWPRLRSKKASTAAGLPAPKAGAAPVELVVIGASTGGPPALQTILSGLPKDFSPALLIVQHMAAGFLPGMIGWLRGTSGIPLGIASDGETVVPGRAYFAPDGFQMGIEENGMISLASAAQEHGARPSVSYLFRSAAKSYGAKAAGVLLTGMGSDGALELKLLKDRGAITIAQDRESSVVYGMPAVAAELDAATYILPPEQIPAALAALMKKKM